MEFDHLFICVPGQASEAQYLVAAGFTEGTCNSHPGQGTANRRFFFNNAFIELLYIENHEALCSELTEPTRLKDRFDNDESLASPFGVCFRPAVDQKESFLPAFQSTVYRPRYLPPHLHVDIADTPLTQPMWFYLSFGGRPDSVPAERREVLEHPSGVSEITAVRVSGSGGGEAAQDVLRDVTGPVVQFIGNDDGNHPPLMEIEFDNQRRRKTHDFRPGLPLVCRW